MSALDDHNARMKMLDNDPVLNAFIYDDIVYLDKDNKPEPTLSLFIDNVIQFIYVNNCRFMVNIFVVF